MAVSRVVSSLIRPLQIQARQGRGVLVHVHRAQDFLRHQRSNLENIIREFGNVAVVGHEGRRECLQVNSVGISHEWLLGQRQWPSAGAPCLGASPTRRGPSNNPLMSAGHEVVTTKRARTRRPKFQISNEPPCGRLCSVRFSASARRRMRR